MIHITREERYYLGAIYPPIWVENLLKSPPSIYTNLFTKVRAPNGSWSPIYARPALKDGQTTRPGELPIDEQRYAIAREILIALGGTRHGREMGLPEVLLTHLEDSQDYFARVLLAPDPLISSYRRQGKDIRGFAETFLIPTRIANERWKDTIFS
jgi:hypothetical protein